MELYIGFVPTKDKRSLMPFKDKSSKELLTLDEAQKLHEYAGILNDNTVLVDIDQQEQADILLKIVRTKQVKCRVIKTDRGCHFLFHNDGRISNNRTHTKVGIGLTADIKGVGKASYEVLKMNGVEREVVYDTGVYDTIPKWLTPIVTTIDVFNIGEGGRNDSLFRLILPLQSAEFTMEECRECIEIINEYVLSESLSERELATLLRDGSFETPTFFTSRGGFMFDKFAKYMITKNHICKIDGKLHIYKDGYYRTGDDIIESTMVEHIQNLTQNKRKEVLSYLDLIVPNKATKADAHLIAFKNGIFDISNGNFLPFSPEYIITNMIPHNYNREATCELLNTTMLKLACNDEQVVTLLYQAIGYCMYRRNELRKSFFLRGEKRNGKSTFLDMVENLFGNDNVTNLDLGEIGHEYKTAELTNKLVNIGDDINDEWVSNTAAFKKVVSGGKLMVNVKYGKPYPMDTYAKFFFSANNLPRMGRGKDGAAVLDRMIIIPFDAKFDKNDPDYDPFVKYKLRGEDVMEALIAKSIPALVELLADQEFIKCDKTTIEIADYERSNNPILDFFDETDKDECVNEAVRDVYLRYSVFCSENNQQALSAVEFRKQIKKQFGLETKFIIDGKGKRTKVYCEG